METARLNRFAQQARRDLRKQVSAKLAQVLAEDSAARRESPDAVRKLEQARQNDGPEQVLERVAYIWFNRFCALRFMDANRYTRIGVVSPAEGQFLPEILAEAKMGHIDEATVPDPVRRQYIFDLLGGKVPSRDAQTEAYRLLLVAACNFWNKAMPFMFQRIQDYTELLMPDDLLSGASILAYTREAMTPDVCKNGELIDWLYQFYNAEKKDKIFEDFKKKRKKIAPEDIPAATQLRTSDWIACYLVENSLGRLWLLNRPGSKLARQMAYYIPPEQPETDFPRLDKPEDLKICDPACGSGRILTYAFDLLYTIYEEEGYDPAEIPEKILKHNLYGMEIDERAGELAALALAMKPRARQRRFFDRGVKPNIRVLENVRFDDDELKAYMEFIGPDMFPEPLQKTLHQFREANHFGSLIEPEATDVAGVLGDLESKDIPDTLFIRDTHHKVLQALRQADYLSPKYHVVIANPPYMGIRGMNRHLAAWLENRFPEFKHDLCQAFILRNTRLAVGGGSIAMITMQNWMFGSRYEALRSHILTHGTILSMAQLGTGAFDAIGGAVVSTTAFVLSNHRIPGLKGQFIKLTEGKNEDEKSQALLNAAKDPKSDIRFSASDDDFEMIPGRALVFWASEQFRSVFRNDPALSDYIVANSGLRIGNNDLFLRRWHEVSQSDVAYGMTDAASARASKKKWFPYAKGGGSRRWYGYFEYLLNWFDDGVEIKNFKDEKTGQIRSAVRNVRYGFRAGFTWSLVSGSDFAVRDVPVGFMCDAGGPMGFVNSSVSCDILEAFLNSKVSISFLRMLAPTLNFNLTPVLSLPFKPPDDPDVSARIEQNVQRLVSLARADWDAFETSWDFIRPPLLEPAAERPPRLEAIYQRLRAHWHSMTLETQKLEQENNRLFIDAYGLQAELDKKVELGDVTLTCNPHYRYGDGKTDAERERLLLADTMRELVSYAVGCMFGRYGLDKPGLLLTNQGETFKDWEKHVPEATFRADADNVLPVLDGDWFRDDIVGRFRTFLRAAFGETAYAANLQFVERALNVRGRPNYTIRDYFLNEFYADHVKRYKKRPIYWLFSSPRGSFNALIYMHRYRPDTVSVVLSEYLREFRAKLASHKTQLESISISSTSSPAEKTKALKAVEKTAKMLAEIEAYERDVLYPLATEQIAIDLDDGVKVNYPKLGAALRKIPGLED